jgi:hypothetical protein
MKNVDEIKFNGVNITNLTNSDDAVFAEEGRKKLQKMTDKLNEAGKAYGIKINVKKT